MSQYNFVAPINTPSITQDIAGALQTGISVYRQKKKDASDEQERQMGDVERGWAPGGSSTPALSSADGTPDNSPSSMPGFSPDDGSTPVGAAQVASSASGAIAAGLGAMRSARSDDPMAGNDESYASMGGSSSAIAGPSAPTSAPAPIANTSTPDPKTSSGQPADTRTGDAPNANDVRVGGMTYDFRRSTQGQQMQFADQLTTARAQRQQLQANADRDRKATDLVSAGFTPGQAGAMADGSLNASDVQVAPGTAATIAAQLGESRDRIASEQGIAAGRNATDLQVAGMRERGENSRAAIAHGDQHDASIDRYIDDATQGYNGAVKNLSTLQTNDPRQFSSDPSVVAQWTAEVSSAQADVNNQHARMKQYQGIGDARTKKLTGIDPNGTTAPGALKKPSLVQSGRAASDPQYRQYLQENGYDVSPPPGGFNSPFRMP